LPRILRCAAHHQASDEHRQQREDQDAVEARAHAARQHFPELDQEQRYQPTQRGEAADHGVHSAARGTCGGGGEQRGQRQAEADVLAFHVALSRIDTEARP
jgi:hypothetical protein